MGQVDDVEVLVAQAIVAVQGQNYKDIAAAYEALSPLDISDVLSELLLCIDDAVDDFSPSVLLREAQLPLPIYAKEMISAAQANDMVGLLKAIPTDAPEELLANLMILVASLKDTQDRLSQ